MSKTKGQFGFFDFENQLDKIYQLNNLLPKLNALINGVTDASVHDSVPYLDVMPSEPAYPDQEAFSDSAYTGEKIDTGLRSIGFARARFWIGMRNLTYNLGRFVSLKCPKVAKVR